MTSSPPVLETHRELNKKAPPLPLFNYVSLQDTVAETYINPTGNNFRAHGFPS